MADGWSSWYQTGPCRPSGHKSLSVSPVSSLQEIGFIQPPRPSLSSNGQIQTVANQGREGTRRQGRSSQETIAQPGGRVPAPARGIHITVSLSCFADTETSTGWEKLAVCCPQARRPRPAGARRLVMPTPTYLTTNQSEERPRADHALFEPWL